MLGLGDNKSNVPVGAKDKLAIAKQMREAGRYNINQQGSGSFKYPSQAAIVAVIYVLSTVLAMLLTDAKSNPFASLNLTGNHAIDQFIGGTDIHSFTGNADEDRLFTILGRGAVFFIISGLVPLISFALEKVFLYKRVQPLLICWGVIITALLLNLAVPLGDIISFFKDLAK